MKELWPLEENKYKMVKCPDIALIEVTLYLFEMVVQHLHLWFLHWMDFFLLVWLFQ